MNVNVIETRVRIENFGYKRADRLLQEDFIVFADRVGCVRGADFVDVEGERCVRLTLQFFGSYGDEYDGDDIDTLIVERDRLFSRLEVRAC